MQGLGTGHSGEAEPQLNHREEGAAVPRTQRAQLQGEKPLRALRSFRPVLQPPARGSTGRTQSESRGQETLTLPSTRGRSRGPAQVAKAGRDLDGQREETLPVSPACPHPVVASEWRTRERVQL